MKNNLKAAVGIITALSLLLGLSLGQIQRQYRQIQALQEEKADLEASTIYFEMPDLKQECEKAILQELEAGRAEIEAMKEEMRAARAEQLEELHEQIERVKAMHHP